jgi:hypothetical protein
LKGRTIINAKALIASLTYTPVPIALVLIGLSKEISSSFTLLIPFVEAVAVVAACIFQIAFFVKPRRIVDEISGLKFVQAEGFSIMAGSDVKRLLQSFAISSSIVLLPVMSYSVTFLSSLSHGLSIGIMTTACAVELATVLLLVRKAVR